MKLGTETGSLINHVLSTSKQTEPKAGDGATVCSWTDRHPATILRAYKGRAGKLTVEVQMDTAKRIDRNGLSECQEYEYSPNSNGARYFYELQPSGKWRQIYIGFDKNGKLRWKFAAGYGLVIGRREKYHDFSF